MIKIRDIEKAVTKLPESDFTKFRTWFQKYDAAKWDKKFEEDVQAGKLDQLARKAVEDFKKGNCKEL